jgi:multiple sugar transport system substrate-binding protein
MKRMLTTLSILLLVAGSALYAAPTMIQVTMEGYAGDFGTIDQIQTKLQAVITKGGIPADQMDNTKWKLKYLQTLAKVTAAKGVTWTGLDWGWAEQLTQKEMNAFLASTGPDVLVGETQMPGFAFNGYLLPFPDALAAKVKATVVQGAYQPMTVNGKIYGIATYPGVNALFWNKDLVQKAGLDPNKGPATWSEWLKWAQQITQAGKGAFYGGGTYAGPNFGGSLRVGPFMMMAGGGFVGTDGRANFNTPENVKALAFMRDLAKNSPPGAAAGAAEGGWWDALNQGKIAYVVDGPWRLQAGISLNMNIGYSVLPIPDGGSPANVTIGAAFYGVPKYAKNPAAAFTFIEALIDKSVQDLIVENNNRPPVLKAYQQDSKFMSSYMATFFKALQGNVTGLPTYPGNQNAKIWDVFHQAMTQAIITNGDIKSILDNAQALAEKYESQ